MDPQLRRHGRALHAAFATEEAIYGVLLVSGLIVVASLHSTSSLDVLTVVAGTVAVFWLAHVYAGTVAHYGVFDGHMVDIRHAMRLAVRETLGMLVAALIPCALLLLGTLRVVPDDLAGWLALWSCVAILGILGYVAFRRRGASVPTRLLGAASTAAFGMLMALLKAIVH